MSPKVYNQIKCNEYDFALSIQVKCNHWRCPPETPPVVLYTHPVPRQTVHVSSANILLITALISLIYCLILLINYLATLVLFGKQE